MPRPSANAISWLIILCVALGVRLAAGAWWQSRMADPQQLYFPDSLSYWALGRAIAGDQPYEFLSPEHQVFRTPGYPLLLAGLFRIYGGEPPVMAARALSAVLGTLAVAAVGWWTTWLFDPRAGRAAGWIAALYPTGVSMGAFVLTEAPFSPLMILHLSLWGLAWRAQSTPRALALAGGGGIAAALATLMRPSWLLFTPFALLLGLLLSKPRARHLTLGLAMCLGLAVTMLPWWVRNARVTGHLVTTTLQFGASLYDGLNPNANGAGGDMAFVPRFEAEEHALDGTPEGADLYEYRLDRRMARAAVDWAWANPGRVLELAWIKTVRTWNVWPNEPAFRSWPLRLLVFVTYTPLAILSLVGIWRYTRRGWPYVLVWLPALYFTLLHAVFTGSLRYREPAMLALTVLAAAVLTSAVPAALNNKSETTAGPSIKPV